MRRSLASACFTALMMATLAPQIGHAQAQLPALTPPPAAPIKPFKSIAVTPPAAFNDPSFAAFRKTLGDVAERKDRAALAKLVVSQGFFWVQDKDYADKHKSGIDNLAKAVDLDAKGSGGWDVIAGFATEPTASALAQHKDIVCAPADPTLNTQDFEELIKSTDSDPSDWGYPTKPGLEVRAAAKPTAPVVETLGMVLVEVLPDSTPQDSADAPSFLHVATPSGKSGYVQVDGLIPLGGDQMCYAKDASGWKIAGYVGGANP